MHTEFTPFLSLAGGMLIGLATAILLLVNGRIAGISGIVSSILPPNANRSKLQESLAFIIGLMLAIPAYILFHGSGPDQTITSNTGLLIVGGLLVGLGAATANGCTSGHGVCGISRVSKRSIIATLTFMFTAAVTVFIIRHVVGL